MSWSLINFISVAIQILFFCFGPNWFPKAQPVQFQENIMRTLTGITIVLTGFNISIFHYIMAAPPLILVVALVALALASPCSGLLEARKQQDPGIFRADRFKMHAVTNVLAAVIAWAFAAAARWAPDLGPFVSRFGNEAALNIVLPISATVAFAYVRSQQVEKCPDLDQRIGRNDPDWEEKITGFSLRHAHQRWNIAHLIVAIFIIATAVLFLLTSALKGVGKAAPSNLSGMLAFAFTMLLTFLATCGLPVMRKYGAVYWTFLAGMPVATIVILVWVLALKDDAFRNIYAVSVAIASSCVYGVLVAQGGAGGWKMLSGMYDYTVPILLASLAVVTGGLLLS